jgi:hypothetical protein
MSSSIPVYWFVGVFSQAKNLVGQSMRLHNTFTRREFFRAAGLAGLGLGLVPDFASGIRPIARSGKQIRSCILIFYYGGPSHLDMLDPKPDAPAEVRGEYRAIATSVPGLRVCEHLPCMARLMHKVAVIRSLHHPMRNHNSAAAEALTGRTPAGGDQELLTDDPRGLPTFGSAVSYALGSRANILPYVALPYTLQTWCNCRGRRRACLAVLMTASRWKAIRPIPISAWQPSTELVT